MAEGEEGPLNEPAHAACRASAAFTAFRDRSRFAALDGLRALSVVAVIWHHTGAPLVPSTAAQQGHQGVTLFFAISGLLITTLLLREREREGAIDLRAFYVRRTLRIFPLYYAVLSIYVLAAFVLERHTPAGQAFFANLIFFATYTSNLFVALDGRVLFYFSWSLAAEEQFYLIWPPLLKYLRTRGRALALAAGVVVTLAVVEYTLPWLMAAAEPVQATLRKVPLAIVAGVVGALLLHDRQAFMRCWPWLAASRWHSVAWLAITLTFALNPALPWAGLQVSAALLVMACCMREDHALARLLNLGPLVYAGTISYGLYLLHSLCKGVIVKAAAAAGIDLGPGTLFVATLLVSVVVAGLSFRYFESPILRLKKRFEHAPGARRMAA